MPIPPHHRLANSLASSSTTTTEYASSTSSSRASSPSQTHSVPFKSLPHSHSLPDRSADEDEDDNLSRPSSEDLRSSTYSDSYDSSADSRSGRNSVQNPLTPSTASSSITEDHAVVSLLPTGTASNLAVEHVYPHHMWSDSSRVSSRAASPAPGGDGFDGYLSYRAGTTGARLGGAARSRSGFSTPTTPAELEEKDAYDTECK